METKTKGVVLIAGGHPIYTHYAYNLALSIRDHSQIPIMLYYHGAGISYLFQDQLEVFTSIEELPQEYFMVDGKEQFVKSKLHLYELSPFDETIFLDTDTIFTDTRVSGKTIEMLFEENANSDIQFACRAEKNMDEPTRSEWITLSEIEAKYGFKHWYELSSEFIYFKKNKVAKSVFDKALYYYFNHGLGTKKWIIENGQKKLEEKPGITEFAGGIPDEVPFGLALESLGVSIKAPYHPSYWQPEFFNRTIPDNEIIRNHYLISIGGAALQPNTRRIYDDHAKHYCGKTTFKRAAYRAVEKSSVLKERRFI